MTTLQFRTGNVTVLSAMSSAPRTANGRGEVRLDEQIEHDYDQVPLLLPDPDSTDLPLAADYARYVGKYFDLETADLLDRLAEEHGLMWLTIAQVAEVSIPALRKWRHGGNPTPSNKLALARLLAACEALEETGIPDVAAWLNTPIRFDQKGLRVELLTLPEGGLTLLELAKDKISQAEALDALDSTWRRRYTKPVTVVSVDADGFGTVHLAEG